MSTDVINRTKSSKANSVLVAYAESSTSQALPANTNREGLMIQNLNDGAAVDVYFGDGSATTPTIVVPSEGYYESGITAYTGEVTVSYTEATGANGKGVIVTELGA